MAISLKSFKTSFVKSDKWLSARPLIVMVGILLLCGGIIILRAPHAIINPQFWAEDGVLWFQDAYNYGLLHTVILPYSGSFDLLYRVGGWLGTLVPLAQAPLFFSCFAIACQLLPVFIVMSSRFTKIVKYRWVAIAVSLMYVTISNSAEVFVNLANIQWHLGVAAFMVLIASKPKNRKWLAFDLVLLAVTGLTGALTFGLVIIAFVVWLKERDKFSRFHLEVLGFTTIIQALCLLLVQPGQRGGHAEISILNLIKMIVGQIFTGSILGTRNVTLLYHSPLLYLVLAGGLAIMIYAIKTGPNWLRYANLYGLIMFGMFLVSLKPLEGVDLWGILTHSGAGQRYWYVPIFVWLTTVLWVALAARNTVMRSVCRVLLVLLVVVGIPLSWRIPPFPDQHYKTHVSKMNDEPDKSVYKIPVNPVPWSILLIKR